MGSCPDTDIDPNPSTPITWMLILASICYTIPFKLVTSLSIHLTCLLSNVWILLGEVTCLSLLRVEELQQNKSMQTRQNMQCNCNQFEKNKCMNMPQLDLILLIEFAFWQVS